MIDRVTRHAMVPLCLGGCARGSRYSSGPHIPATNRRRMCTGLIGISYVAMGFKQSFCIGVHGAGERRNDET